MFRAISNSATDGNAARDRVCPCITTVVRFGGILTTHVRVLFAIHASVAGAIVVVPMARAQEFSFCSVVIGHDAEQNGIRHRALGLWQSDCWACGLWPSDCLACGRRIAGPVAVGLLIAGPMAVEGNVGGAKIA